MSKIFIHIGLSKTGSSFLQELLFPNIDNVNLKLNPTPFMEFNNRSNLYTDRKFYKVQRPLNKLLKENFMYFKKFLKLKFNKVEKHYVKNNTVNIFSSEGLVGSGFRPSKNSLINACILKILYPNAKVILIFRRQEDYLKSIYRQLLFKENRFEQFIKFSDVFETSKKHLDWYKIYKIYKLFFGSKNLLILPYELMVSNLEEFTYNILNFVDSKANLPQNYFNILVNSSNIKNYQDTKINFYDEVENYKFQDIFKKSNLKLEKYSKIKFCTEFNY